MQSGTILERASEFIWTHARLLERRVFAHRFLGGASGSVVQALRAYQNEDGGFGQALEPDLRAPHSHPIHVEFALRTLYEVGARDTSIGGAACEYLAAVADARGSVPPSLPSARDYPCANHWNAPWAIEPSLNPTVGIAGLLHWLGVGHPWLDRATDYCWEALSEAPVKDAHTLLGAVTFLEHTPDRGRAEGFFRKVADKIFEADWFNLDLPVQSYGLTPLHFAPSPQAYCRPLFSDEVIDAHLEDLRARQEEDGGWPILWDPPGPAAQSEWRGRWTLDAVSVLDAYDRL
jgi:hypothetical protein